MVVSINQVLPCALPSNYHIRKMKAVLEKQGQIEPLQVTQNTEGKYITFNEDAWGNEIVYAARELGWDTILVCETPKYLR